MPILTIHLTGNSTCLRGVIQEKGQPGSAFYQIQVSQGSGSEEENVEKKIMFFYASII